MIKYFCDICGKETRGMHKEIPISHYWLSEKRDDKGNQYKSRDTRKYTSCYTALRRYIILLKT